MNRSLGARQRQLLAYLVNEGEPRDVTSFEVTFVRDELTQCEGGETE